MTRGTVLQGSETGSNCVFVSGFCRYFGRLVLALYPKLHCLKNDRWIIGYSHPGDEI